LELSTKISNGDGTYTSYTQQFTDGEEIWNKGLPMIADVNGDGLDDIVFAWYNPGNGLQLQTKVSNGDDSKIQAEDTIIYKCIKSLNYKINTYNLTNENKTHWIKKKKILDELKDEFLKEGNDFIYNNRFEECDNGDHNKECRFLYIITKTPTTSYNSAFMS
jgi:hypothetical protein